MIRTIIIDDEKPNIALLQNLAKKYCPELEILSSANNINDGLELIQNLKPDLLFLDIEIHAQTGFDLLDALHQENLLVILVTAYEKYALKAHKYNVLDYLLKPIQITELVNAVHKAATNLQKIKAAQNAQAKPADNLYMALPHKNHLAITNMAEIIRLEASNNYTKIFTQDGIMHTTSHTLKDYEDKLPTEMFVRVHSSHIINLKHVSKYIRTKNGNLVMCDNTEIPISASRKKEVKDRIVF